MNCVYVAKIDFDRLISSEKRDDFADTDFGLNFSTSSKNWSKRIPISMKFGKHVYLDIRLSNNETTHQKYLFC